MVGIDASKRQFSLPVMTMLVVKFGELEGEEGYKIIKMTKNKTLGEITIMSKKKLEVCICG